MSIIFSFNERGFDFDAEEADGGEALITIRRGVEVVRQFRFPAYKVYNIAAHASEIVDGLLAGNDEGLLEAGATGLGGNVYSPLSSP